MALEKKKMREVLRRAEEEKRIQLKRALKASEIQLPEKERFHPVEAEYKKFLEELRQKPKNWYEIFSWLAGKILPIEPSPKTKIKIEEGLKAAYINATAKGAYSLAFLTM